MDEINYTTVHRKGQHLLSEERHEIEVRLKDSWSIYKIAKHLGRPYNTIKNEIQRGTELKANGKPKRYKADSGKKAYLENRKNCRRVYRFLQVSRFLVFVTSKFSAMRNGRWMQRSEQPCAAENSVVTKWSAPKHCTIMWISDCFPLKYRSSRKAAPQYQGEKIARKQAESRHKH